VKQGETGMPTSSQDNLQKDRPLKKSAQIALIMVQASSRSWSGGEDLSVRLVEGVPAFIQTIFQFRGALPETPLAVIAPDYDRGGCLDQWLSESQVSNTSVFYGFDSSPLRRMVAATEHLRDADYVIRVNGLNLFTDPRMIQEMVEALQTHLGIDCYKMTDDYPAALCLDIYRIGALRKALALLPQENEHHIHVKYFMASQPAFKVISHPPTLYYTDEQMLEFKAKSHQLHTVERTKVDNRLGLPMGDQLKLHYELASKKIKPSGVILDIGCGTGYGSAYLAEEAKTVIAGDCDPEALQEAQDTYGHIGNIVFKNMNAEATELPDDSVDAITSFETIEHVENVERYLKEFHRILKPGGLVFFSTPQNAFGKIPLTYWHHTEFSYQELKDWIESRFDIVEFIGIKQGRIYFQGDPIGNNSFVIARSRKPLPYVTL
jgi:2-polyprenyl-3-methyl-5-hydroxy-6-metoxy-1,4-benzoquinol methylase